MFFRPLIFLFLSFASSIWAYSPGQTRSKSNRHPTPETQPPAKGDPASAGKRGLSYSSTTLTTPFESLGENSKLSWAYDWEPTPQRGQQASTKTLSPAFEFIPTLWSDADSHAKAWNRSVTEAVARYGTKHLFSFNEPDSCGSGSSCMSVERSVAAYQKYIMPWADGKLKLGTPAVTNSGDKGKGLSYTKEFMAACKGCVFDFANIHWYGKPHSAPAFIAYVQKTHEELTLPIVISEFGIIAGTQEQQMEFLTAVLPWLDKQPYVQLYAIYKDKAGILVNEDLSLTRLGEYYGTG